MARKVTFNIPKEFIVSREAGAALAEAPRFVKESSSGKVTYTAANEAADFILLYPAALGEAATCVRPGCDAPIETGEAIGAGVEVESGADGVAMIAAAAGSVVNGKTTNTTLSNAAGEEVAITFLPKAQRTL